MTKIYVYSSNIAIYITKVYRYQACVLFKHALSTNK